MLRWWKCLLNDSDDTLTVFKKKVLFAAAVYAIFTCGLGMYVRKGTESIGLVPGMLGGVALLGSLVVKKRVDASIVEGALYACTASVLMNDWYAARRLDNRMWPLSMVLLDIAMVCRLSSRVSVVLVNVVVLWLALVTSESMFRWGLFDLDVSDVDKDVNCDCEDPPCARGTRLVPVYFTNVMVFVLDFYFTRGFAHGLNKQHSKMQAAIDATERIASSLSQFDLISARAVLAASPLPLPLFDAFERILANLDAYRPYLPEALFADLHSDSLGSRKEVPAPAALSGRAAIVFTDIQGSTAIWGSCPEGMRDGLRVHDSIIRERLAAFDGYEVKTIGDAFMAAFESASNAVQFGLAVQEGLVNASWPPELLQVNLCQWLSDGPWCGLRVRIGIHYGAVDIQLNSLTGRYDYFGNTVNKASRMEGACVGGAVAVTQEVLDEVGEVLNAHVFEMGETSLKGIADGVYASLLLPINLIGRRKYVEKQMLLKREDRKIVVRSEYSYSSRGSVNSSISTEHYKVDNRLQQRNCATVCMVEAVVEEYTDVESVNDEMNNLLNKVATSSERTHGTIVSLQGSRVAVCWNGAKPCASHIESSFVFVRLVGVSTGLAFSSECNMGLCTAPTIYGAVGGRRQKFMTVLGTSIDVASRLSSEARASHALCLYASVNTPAPFDNLGLCIEGIGTITAPNGSHMYLVRVNDASLFDTVHEECNIERGLSA
eukprot:TRINITY_DN7024_c0_g1_i2.p1 TRINITY_DN7024_c0_g1~~TRINITY_DN7024_c0_g1_i2.p1  ORF type:complete len:716 (+),score=207.81 TRINITY_DN7024_c0_g1_i2:37-2184(+)